MALKRHLPLLALLLFASCPAAIVIPIEIEKGNPIAAARINGVAVRLVIDSGGGVVSLKPETVGRVGAARTGSTKNSVDALGNSSMQTLFSLDTMELGGNIFSNVEAGEMGRYGAGSPGDGIIGRNFLNQFVAIYDYAAQRITLLTPEESRAARRECRGARIRAIPDADRIIVSMVTTDHGAMRMLWDTGATYSFAKKTFADTRELPLEGPFYKSQRFKLGSRDFGPLDLVVLDIRAPANVDGYIGYNFFMGHVVCIDPLKHVIRIRKK